MSYESIQNGSKIIEANVIFQTWTANSSLKLNILKCIYCDSPKGSLKLMPAILDF